MYKRQKFMAKLNEKTQAKRDWYRAYIGNWYRAYIRNGFDIDGNFDKKGRFIRKLKFDVRYYPIIKEAVKMGYLSPEDIELIKLKLRAFG